jgi:serpin B
VLKLTILVVMSVALLEIAGCSSGAEVAIEKFPINASMLSGNDTSGQVNSNNIFALNLYQKIKDSSSNIFYSPYSISSALAMVYAGARGETAQQMSEALHFALPNAVFHTAMYSIQQDLEKRNNSRISQLSIANAIWGQKDKNFLPEYINQINSYYNGACKNLDFVKDVEESRSEINQWVSDNTDNRVTDLIKPGSIDNGTSLVITNAVYFKAFWQSVFSRTTEDIFYTLDGKNIIVQMMKHDVMKFKYLEGDSYQAIELPYKDCDLSMLILLPDEGQFTTCENSMDIIKLDSIIGSLQDTSVVLKMPKFKFEADYLLNENLKAQGMLNAFGNADFSGMTDTPGLFIDKVLHGTFISVDEKGTEGAAAVGVVVTSAARINMVVNRPFVFLIKDNVTDTMLFMGRVLNPQWEMACGDRPVQIALYLSVLIRAILTCIP